ncbi:MAG: tetratricopeptide repeat protein [Acidobacteriota bacterium]|nr:tetratricopeptide repeat protein [Acidobacteriota bacterium]
MKKLLALLLLISTSALSFPAASARQTEGTPAWQVLQYDISVSAGDPAGASRAITARAVISARNVGTGAGRTLTLRLNENAKIESASVGNQPATFRSGKDASLKVQTAQLQLPANIPPGSNVTATIQYSLPVATNTGLEAVSPEGLQFLPLSYWYPTPNTPVAPRGADYAPLKLAVNGLTGGDTLVSTGKATAGGVYEQALNSQPFFVTGRWETVEGSAEARGVSAMLHQSPSAEERREAEALVNLAASARAFYAGLLGPASDSPIRLVGVRRGAGFDTAGTLLLDHAVFRRQKVDSVTATQIADAVARLWVGGATPVEGEGAGVVREGLARYLSLLFIEKQFGRAAAEAELTRMAMLYAPIAERDAPLAKLSPAYETYFNSATNKGALVWRLLASAAGREAFAGMLRSQFAAGAGRAVTLASLRERLAEAGGDRLSHLMSSLFDLPTDTDLLVGLPQPRGGAWVSNLRNTGSFDVEVAVEALTDRGERLTTTARIPAKDFGVAEFRTASKIVRVEVDPEKLYPQTNYANDVAPQGPGTPEAVEQARIQLGQQPAQAEALARAILARVPSSEEARVVLARALLEQNRLDDAEREFRAALDSPLPLASTLAWSDIGLGEVALKRNRAGEAARLFDAAAKSEAEYASTLAARADRLKAEAAAGTPPAPDEQVKAAVAALDAAIRGGRKTEIDALIVPGELPNFSKGIIGTQPDVWQTRVLRTDQLSPDRFAADVVLTARTLGQDRSGPAVYVFARTPAGWKLSEIPIFEVR